MSKVIDYDYIADNYNSSLTDVENSKILRCCVSTVRKWRKDKNIKTVFGKAKKLTEEVFYKYYNMGLNDTEIARLTGSTPPNVFDFRVRRGLESNNPRSRVDLGDYEPDESAKPWVDPESLFCSDLNFLMKVKEGDV